MRVGWRALSRLGAPGVPSQALPTALGHTRCLRPLTSLASEAKAFPGWLSCPSLGSKQRPDIPSLGRLQPLKGETGPSILSRFHRVLGTPGRLIMVAKDDHEGALAVPPPKPLPHCHGPLGTKIPRSHTQGLPDSGTEERREVSSPLLAQGQRGLSQASLCSPGGGGLWVLRGPRGHQ